MAYEMVMPYHLHMPSYFLETFTEYPILNAQRRAQQSAPAVDGIYGLSISFPGNQHASD